MIKKERQERILKFVSEVKFASLSQISKELDVSESTIRRDLEELSEQGKIIKERGGAQSISFDDFSMVDQNLFLREKIERESKLKIAREAINLIPLDSTIYIDAGSSTLILAKTLPSNFRVNVVTNSFTIAKVLSEKGINAFLIGGKLKLTTDAVVGSISENYLSNFHFKLAFMGSNVVNVKQGFMTPGIDEANLKTKAIQQSEKVYFLVDKTKFNKTSVVSFAFLSDGVAITDYVDAKDEFKELKIMEVK